MTTEEKIKEASEKFIETRRYDSRGYPPVKWFVAGALSPEAKEHWQQGMYTEEQVRGLVFMAYNLRTEDNHVRSTESLTAWFNDKKLL